ncbi:hypothetical protein ATKI12_1369 [Kitasatospora sp. Ki12]
MDSRTLPELPELTTRRLPGGLTLVASGLSTTPLVQAHLAVPIPVRRDADGAVFDVLAACWPDLPACARFEQHGGAVSVARRGTWLFLSLVCLGDRLPLLARTLADAVTAGYTEEQVRRAASRAAQQASLAAAQPAVQSARLLWEDYYGALPAFLNPAPDPAAIVEVTARDVNAAHARAVSPRDAYLVVVGDRVGREQLDVLEEHLAAWTPGDGEERATVPRPPLRPGPAEVRTRHRDGWPQAHIRLAAEASSRRELRSFAADQIAALILGGSFASRINTVLREERGLAYRTAASVGDHLDGDVFAIEADVGAGAVPEAMARLGEILDRFADDGPTAAELRDAVGHMTGKYVLNLGAQSSRAACLLSFLTLGMPLTDIADLPAHMASLTAEDVRRAASRMRLEHLRGVVCTDSAAVPTGRR